MRKTSVCNLKLNLEIKEGIFISVIFGHPKVLFFQAWLGVHS